MDTHLSPEQARARFGELQHGPSRTYQHFETPEGDWRPEFGPGMVLTGYRLIRPVKAVAKEQARWRGKR